MTHLWRFEDFCVYQSSPFPHDSKRRGSRSVYFGIANFGSEERTHFVESMKFTANLRIVGRTRTRIWMDNGFSRRELTETDVRNNGGSNYSMYISIIRSANHFVSAICWLLHTLQMHYFMHPKRWTLKWMTSSWLTYNRARYYYFINFNKIR